MKLFIPPLFIYKNCSDIKKLGNKETPFLFTDYPFRSIFAFCFNEKKFFFKFLSHIYEIYN